MGRESVLGPSKTQRTRAEPDTTFLDGIWPTTAGGCWDSDDDDDDVVGSICARTARRSSDDVDEELGQFLVSSPVAALPSFCLPGLVATDTASTKSGLEEGPEGEPKSYSASVLRTLALRLGGGPGFPQCCYTHTHIGHGLESVPMPGNLEGNTLRPRTRSGLQRQVPQYGRG